MAEFCSYQSNRIPRFRPVFKKWIELNRKYCRESHWNDIPWGYIERASVSVFAAACWSAGCIALEEYSELKAARGSRTGENRLAPGRCDLFVGFKNKAYIFEAKMIRPSLASSNWMDQVDSGLEAAQEAVRKTHAPNRENKLGMLIVAPTISRNRRHKANELIGGLVEFLRNREDICSAWFFPKHDKIRRFAWRNEMERTYPGTAVLIKALRTSS